MAGGGQWKVRQVVSEVAPSSIRRAELALTGYRAIGEDFVAVDHIDFGPGGNFAEDAMFPAQRFGENNYALEATGQINVTTPGLITFGVQADDRVQLEIDGSVVVAANAIGQDEFGSVFLAPGLHDVRAVFYEGSGFEYAEVFVAEELGSFAAFTEADFELLDSVTDQAPNTISPSTASYPGNAGAGAVVANLDATGGAGGENRYELVYPIDPASPILLLQRGSTGWRFLDGGAEPASSDWTGGAAFDDSTWGQGGQSPIGFGDADIITAVDGGATGARWPAVYFRQNFAVPVGDLERIDSVLLRVRRDDGAAIYINGVEIARDNVPVGADNTTFAFPTAGGINETTYFEYPVDIGLLVDGVNTLAVAVHQANATSSDMILDVEIEYNRRSDLSGDEQYFAIAGNQLVLRQDAAAMPAGPFDVDVRAINAYGASSEQTVAVSAGANAAADPTAVTLDNSNVGEGLPVGTLVGRLDATDADAAEGHTFALNAGLLFPDNAGFTISGDRLYTADVFAAATKGSYSINVQATASTGATIASVLTITVDPEPARIAATPSTVPENAAPFAAITNFTTVDPVGGPHTYRMPVTINPVPETLIDFGATWSYLDDGSDQGVVWSQSTFDDAGWATGAAPLGYGALGAAGALESPVTVLGYGGDDDNKYATSYFRTTFNVTDPALVEELVFDMEIDDGAIVYINGVQVFRRRADAVVFFDDYSEQGDGGETSNDVVTLSAAFPELLTAGSNVLAIEIHQANGTSSDLWLDMSLSANLREVSGNDSDHFYLVGNQLRSNKEIGEIPAENGDTLTIQIESTSDLGEVILEDVMINVGPATTFGEPTDIALSNNTIEEGLPPGTVVGTLSGSDPEGGPLSFRLGLNPFFTGNNRFRIEGDQLVTLAALDFDDGSPINIRVTATDNTEGSFQESFAINVGQVTDAPTAITILPTPAEFPNDAEIGATIGTLETADRNDAEVHTYTFGTWPGVAGVPVLEFGSVWSYLDDGSDQGTVWRASGFDDSAWATGAAELGYGDGDEATVTGFIDTDDLTAGDQKNATTYFRRQLTLPVVSGDYVFNLRYDDGAAVYINGTEVYRTGNLPAGALFNTFATANGDALTGLQPIPAGVLVAGANTIAVEMHQSNATSSDISFDMEIAPLVDSPYPAYFNLVGDELRTAVDFTTVGISPPFTFQVPIITEDPTGLTFEDFVAVTMTGGANDTDSDGLLDTWEIDNFGDLAMDGDDDPDGDGRPNSDEYGADTDPNDAGDFLQITEIEVDSIDGVTVTWPAKAGRTYALYRSDDLAAGGWTLVQGGLTTAVAGPLSADDAAAPVPGDRFYRVEAEAPPLQ